MDYIVPWEWEVHTIFSGIKGMLKVRVEGRLWVTL